MSDGDWTFSGARWWKFDFHCHSPASSDYGHHDGSLKSLLPRDWLLACMEKQIDCIAITDHNSGEWIDTLKTEYAVMETEKQARFRELYLFPGVEISVQGGIHLLALFDPAKSRDDIFALLSDSKIRIPKERQGTPDAVSTGSFLDVVALIDKSGGLALPAHVGDSSGLFAVLNDGPTLKLLLESPHLFAAEVLDKNYAFPGLYTDCKASWSKVVGSDAHRPDEIGRRFTWIKMGDPSIEGLKLALLDNDLSVIRFDSMPDGQDPNDHADFVIRSIEIEKSRYCGNGQPIHLSFNPWLNCLIGGRGSGKSTIVEFLRLTLRRDREIKKLFGDSDFGEHERSELVRTLDDFFKEPAGRADKGVLKPDTKITVDCRLNGEEFRLSWQERPDGSIPPIQKWNGREYEKSSGEDIATRFPVRIYSQKQMYQMAQNPKALLKIIDESPQVDYRAWENRGDQIAAQFRSLKAQERELRVEVGEEENLKGELEDIQSKLALFEKGENATLLKAYQIRRSQMKEVEAYQTSLAENLQSLSDIVLETITPDFALFSDSEEDIEIKNLMKRYTKETLALNERLSAIREECGRMPTRFMKDIEKTAWQTAVQKNLQSYQGLIDELRKNGVENPDAYGLYVQKKQNVETRLSDIKERKKRIEELERQAEEELAKLDAHRKTLSEKRRSFVSDVLRDNKIVRMTLRERGYADGLEQGFRTIIGKEDETFASDILVTEKGRESGILLPLYQEYTDEALHQVKEVVRDLREGGTGESYTVKFIRHLHDKVTPAMTDELDLWIPEDSVEVEYCRDQARNIWDPISQGSAGQKTAAVLAFILSHGSNPIILDQPEDDLDNHLINDLVVEQIREKKPKRQIIVVTHNPNIVVTGDAELVHVMDFSDGQIGAKRSGCLQEKEIRREICQVMEGGAKAFEQRYRRIYIEGEHV
ncbi:MAG: TrlF family AAA-like ATPase [Rectinemataceae bacterium]